jgi:hypothetical protein
MIWEIIPLLVNSMSILRLLGANLKGVPLDVEHVNF